jgi:hypothetical protein
VVDRGVELINWPSEVPFVTASDIGSFHTLRQLLSTLNLDDSDKRCKWVTLSEEEWEKRKAAYYKADGQAQPTKRKQKQALLECSDGSESDNGTDADRAKAVKKRRKYKAHNKENVTPTTSGKATRRNGKGGRAVAGDKTVRGMTTKEVRKDKAAQQTVNSESADQPLTSANGN